MKLGRKPAETQLEDCCTPRSAGGPAPPAGARLREPKHEPLAERAEVESGGDGGRGVNTMIDTATAVDGRAPTCVPSRTARVRGRSFVPEEGKREGEEKPLA